MTGAQLTPARLAAQLVVEGCLPIIAGKVQGKAPVEPVALTQAERGKFGLEQASITLFYPAGEQGVFFDMAESNFMVWFNGADCDQAASVFDAALKRAYPNACQLEDITHSENARMRARIYQVELDEGRLAQIETGYPAPGAGGPSGKFIVRVAALQRRAPAQ